MLNGRKTAIFSMGEKFLCRQAHPGSENTEKKQLGFQSNVAVVQGCAVWMCCLRRGCVSMCNVHESAVLHYMFYSAGHFSSKKKTKVEKN